MLRPRKQKTRSHRFIGLIVSFMPSSDTYPSVINQSFISSSIINPLLVYSNWLLERSETLFTAQRVTTYNIIRQGGRGRAQGSSYTSLIFGVFWCYSFSSYSSFSTEWFQFVRSSVIAFTTALQKLLLNRWYHHTSLYNIPPCQLFCSTPFFPSIDCGSEQPFNCWRS